MIEYPQLSQSRFGFAGMGLFYLRMFDKTTVIYAATSLFRLLVRETVLAVYRQHRDEWDIELENVCQTVGVFEKDE